jgi:hypothetical protein
MKDLYANLGKGDSLLSHGPLISERLQPRAWAARWQFLFPLVSAIFCLLLPRVSFGQSCDPAPAGLISWWRAEGDAIDTIGTNNGILQGGVSFAPGKVGRAFQFNGTSNQYVDIPDNPSLNLTATLTLEAWIYPQLPLDPVASPIIKKWGDGADGYALEFSGTNGVNMVVDLYRYEIANSPIAPVAFNQWNHVAGVFDGTKVSIYVNGVLGGTTAASGQIATTHNDFQLGHDPGNPTRIYNGLIDEASIYSNALSASQILAIYTAGAAGKCGPPPAISGQPLSQSVLSGASPSFTVTAFMGFAWAQPDRRQPYAGPAHEQRRPHHDLCIAPRQSGHRRGGRYVGQPRCRSARLSAAGGRARRYRSL